MKAIKSTELKFFKWMDSEKWHHLCEKLIENHENHKGEYRIIKQWGKDGLIMGAIIHCPGCGRPHPLAPGHSIDFNNGEITIHPSINNIHCCGWHGWLKNGEFVKC